MSGNDLRELFDSLETMLRQRISQVIAKLGSELHKLSERVYKTESRLDDYAIRLEKVEQVIGWKPRRKTKTDRLRIDTKATAETIARRMDDYFNLKELRELCWNFDLEYDDIEGKTRAEKIRSFVMYFYRRNTLDVLIEWLISERPHVEWPSL
ncbi:MAG: hypothetical protein DWQ04_07040 [Chloroflexi bacterium]|nr:MAG: hypothetical protein DWQ04_07040 [Chloroflexota bacterium]